MFVNMHKFSFKGRMKNGRRESGDRRPEKESGNGFPFSLFLFPIFGFFISR